MFRLERERLLEEILYLFQTKGLCTLRKKEVVASQEKKKEKKQMNGFAIAIRQSNKGEGCLIYLWVVESTGGMEEKEFILPGFRVG